MRRSKILPIISEPKVEKSYLSRILTKSFISSTTSLLSGKAI